MLATAMDISHDGNPKDPKPSNSQKLVDVKISYPEDHTGPKPFKEGDVRKGVSMESAQQWVKRGFGTIVSESGTSSEADKSADENGDQTNQAKDSFEGMSEDEQAIKIATALTQAGIKFPENATLDQLKKIQERASKKQKPAGQ